MNNNDDDFLTWLASLPIEAQRAALQELRAAVKALGVTIDSDEEVDPRVQELEELAHAEGFMLPLPASCIIWHEDNGRSVDLETGEIIYTELVAVPTANARAIVHLLAEVEGDVAI